MKVKELNWNVDKRSIGGEPISYKAVVDINVSGAPRLYWTFRVFKDNQGCWVHEVDTGGVGKPAERVSSAEQGMYMNQVRYNEMVRKLIKELNKLLE